jgi:hypothetical protein
MIAKARSDTSHQRLLGIAHLQDPETCRELAVAYLENRAPKSGLKNPATPAFLDLAIDSRDA